MKQSNDTNMEMVRLFVRLSKSIAQNLRPNSTRIQKHEPRSNSLAQKLIFKLHSNSISKKKNENQNLSKKIRRDTWEILLI